MLRSFLVLFICWFGFGVGVEEYSDYMDDVLALYPGTECGQNEVLDCVYSCPPQKTCRTREEIIECLQDVDICVHQCACKEGFFRNLNGGECVSEQQCKKCPGPNEHYACGGQCDNICHTLHLQNKTSCPHTYTDCQPSCYCDDGYARDDDGVCIPLENCRKDNIV